MEIWTSFLLGLVVGASAIAGLAVWLWQRRAAGPNATNPRVMESKLDALAQQLGGLEQQRAAWQAQLSEQVRAVEQSAVQMRQETHALAHALRKPQTRGQWGELHLRRAVELAGMVAHCDFVEQETVAGSVAAQRPDMVIRLAGGRQVVVDSKVPLSAFLDINHGESEVAAAALARHARHVRQHVDALASKGYWRTLSGSAEFVVLFMPGEAFLSAALESDPQLLEYAAARKVILATPTTLIALLRTVAYAWNQASLAERAAEIAEIGRELHERLHTLNDHFARLGRALGTAVTSYNAAIGSYESRVLVTARQFSELSDRDQQAPTEITTRPRVGVASDQTGRIDLT